MKLRVKICGVKTPEDAHTAAILGADAVGLNFVPGTSRFIEDENVARDIILQLIPLQVLSVGVFVNLKATDIARSVDRLGLDAVQLHGEEKPEIAEQIRRACNRRVQIWKAYRIGTADDLARATKEAFPCDAMLLDARAPGEQRGGTGHSFDWSLLESFRRTRPLILAGGLKPENVAAAVQAVKPSGVDTASGVESSPGVKDSEKVKLFIQNAKVAAQAL